MILENFGATGTLLAAVVEGGVSSIQRLPWEQDVPRWHEHMPSSGLTNQRVQVARRMYAHRFHSVFPDDDMLCCEVWKVRLKQTYKIIAHQYGVKWRRRYDRKNPTAQIQPAINHAATFGEAAADRGCAVEPFRL